MVGSKGNRSWREVTTSSSWHVKAMRCSAKFGPFHYLLAGAGEIPPSVP
jgi:hypothetical protein